ncbi:hypothetical protein N8479_09465, partial [Flavobacteriaceae bacterium]|nr:hypothetical protein [Flavobacteriaceae bacterium]
MRIFILFFLTTQFGVCQNITISSNGQTGTSGTNWSISGGILSVTGDADIHPSAISGQLNNGTSLSVITTGYIQVNNEISKTSGGDVTLTLKSNQYVGFNSISSTSNKLNLIVWVEADGGETYGGRIGTVSTNGGHFWAGGGNGSNIWNGLTVGNGLSMSDGNSNWNGIDLYGNISTNNGDVYIAADKGHSDGNPSVGPINNLSITTGSGDVSFIIRDPSSFSYNNKVITLNTTGVLTIAPPSNENWENDFIWDGTGTTHLTGNNSLNGLIINNQSSLGGLSIGMYLGTAISGDTAYNDSKNEKNVTINTDLSVAGPISVYGGSIDVDSNLTATGGNILFDADTGIAVGSNDDGVAIAGGVTVQTVTSGNITIYGRSGNNNTAGLIGIQTPGSGNPISITSAGNITMIGISEAANSSAARGTYFHTTDITAEGNISITGQAKNAGNDYDVSFQESSLTTTNGSITVKAQNQGRINFVDSGSDNPLSAGGGNDITLYANNFGNGISFVTTGEVNLLPGYDSSNIAQTAFSSTQNLGDFTFDNSISGLTVGTSNNNSDITISENINISGPTTIYGDDITISSSKTLTAGTNFNIVLSAASNFINNSGASALNVSGTGRWIVYAADDNTPANFGSLDSNNTAIYGETYVTLAPASVANGNRYVFAETASDEIISFVTQDESITYGDSFDISDNYVLNSSGGSTSITNVHDGSSGGNSGTISLTLAYSVTPSISITATGSNKTNGNDIDTGTYSMTITVIGGTLKSGYSLGSNSNTGNLTVNPANINNASITAIPYQSYTGSAITISPTVTLNGNTLTEGTDFTTSFSNNTEAGTASLTITGMGNYIGSKTVSFTIIKPNPVQSNLILEYNSKNYSSGNTLTDLSGNDRTGTIGTISGLPPYDGEYFTFSNDYIVTPDLDSAITTNNEAHSVEVWVKPSGNGVIASYLGQTTINSSYHFSAIEIVSGQVEFGLWNYGMNSTGPTGNLNFNTWHHIVLTYNGDGSKIKGYVNGQKVGETPDMDFVSPNNLSHSPFHIAFGANDSTNQGDGNYFDGDFGLLRVYNKELSANEVANNYSNDFKITPIVSFDNIEKILGSESFSPTVSSTSTGTISYSISDPTVATASGNTITLVGTGSTSITLIQESTANYNSITVTRTLTVNKAAPTISFADVTKTYGEAAFNLTATSSSTGAFSYTISDANVATVTGSTTTIVGAGTTTVTVSQVADDNYNSATATMTLTVSQADIATATVASIADQTYSGTAITISPTVTFNGSTVTETTDYTVNFTNNTNAGTASLTLTGTGNFTGTKTVSFTIVKAAPTISFNDVSKTYGEV